MVDWLEERLETVYKKDPRYSDKASSLFMLDLGSPEKLPDALRGEKWSFVQLPLSALQQELQLVEQVCFPACCCQQCLTTDRNLVAARRVTYTRMQNDFSKTDQPFIGHLMP